MAFLMTFDIEPDLHTNKYKGVVIGIKKIVDILKKHEKKGIFFTTCDCIEKHPNIFINLKNNGHEIALHGYNHVRYDELTIGEIEDQLKKAIYTFDNCLGFKPIGFRAPQHSINDNTLNLLQKYNFKYDSSYTPLNLLQFFFFPKKIRLNLTSFFSPLNTYKIRQNLKEVPTSSLLIPFVSLTVRILPKFLLRIYVNLIKIFYKQPIFYAHSWDFIRMPNSKIDKLFPHKNFIKKLDYILSLKK